MMDGQQAVDAELPGQNPYFLAYEISSQRTCGGAHTMSSKTSFAKSTEVTYGRRDVCHRIETCSHEWRIGSCLISQSMQILGFQGL